MGNRHCKDPGFADSFDALSPAVQKLAHKNFAILKENPKHPSLHFKRIHGDLWSIRVGQKYRALAVDEADRFRWFWIGSHSEYDRLIANTL